MRNCKMALMLALAFSLTLFIIPTLPVRAEETLIWSGNVSSDGTTTTGPVLVASRQYRIVAREIWWYNYTADLAADAMYYTDSPPHWDWINHYPASVGSFLQINGMPVNWGPFSNGDTGHTYSISFNGTGSAITFKIVDPGPYGNNNCHLPVEIYEYLQPGYTPGFWKHNIGVALGYNRGSYSAFSDGTKLTLAMLQGYAATVGVTLEEAYAAVSARGNREGQAKIRADMANAFNAAAGYGPFID